jgi:hypothetical protein
MKMNTGKVLYDTKSGYILEVTPPTLTARNAMLLAAIKAHPDPNPEDYSRVTEAPTLSGDPAKTDGRDDPDYKNDLQLARFAQRAYLETGLIDACITTHGIERDAVIENFCTQLETMRRYSSGIAENDWEAVLKLFIAEPDELNDLRDLLSRRLPLTEVETAQGRSYFRVVVQGSDLRTTDQGSESSGAVRPAKQHRNKRVDGRDGSGERVGHRPRSRQ